MGMVELDQSSCALNSGSHQLVSASECPRFLESRLTARAHRLYRHRTALRTRHGPQLT